MVRRMGEIHGHLEWAAVARAQHGVISHEQLREAGITRSTTSRWVKGHRLVRLHRGIYAVGHRSLTRDGWWHASVLAGGPGSAITARAACAIWGALPVDHGPIDIIGARQVRCPPPWLRPHRMPIGMNEITTRRRLPVVSLECAIVDLAEQGSPHDVASALDQALLMKLLDRPRLDECVGKAHGRHGLKVLLPAMERLSEHGETFLSRTERRFRDALLEVGLARPEMNVYIRRRNGRPARPDMYWRDARLIVEIDGPQHEMPYQQERDRARDAWLTAAGYRVLRFSVRQVDHHFDEVLACIIAALRDEPTGVSDSAPTPREQPH